MSVLQLPLYSFSIFQKKGSSGIMNNINNEELLLNINVELFHRTVAVTMTFITVVTKADMQMILI
jgi:hypothetical protein